MTTTPPARMNSTMSSGPERLYVLARSAARRKWGGQHNLALLGPELKRAAILAECMAVIAGQDGPAAAPAMLQFAEYAMTRVMADTQP